MSVLNASTIELPSLGRVRELTLEPELAVVDEPEPDSMIRGDGAALFGRT